MTRYGSFLERFVAYLIDWVILTMIYIIAVIPILDFLGYELLFDFVPSENEVEQLIDRMSGVGSVFYLIWLITGWIYFASFESGYRQATPGKQLFGLKVTDTSGRRIDFARASLRYFGKYISQTILFLGYIMAAFTDRRQALHDFIANTIIIKPSSN